MTEPPRKIDAFDTTLRATQEWVDDFGVALGQTHPVLCFRCLRAALHVLRDVLPVHEAIALSAQLPMLLRGAYFEGYNAANKPDRTKSVDELHARIARELEGGLAAPPRDVLRAALDVLDARVSPGEGRKLRQLLPEPIRKIWPEPGEVGPAPAGG